MKKEKIYEKLEAYNRACLRLKEAIELDVEM